MISVVIEVRNLCQVAEESESMAHSLTVRTMPPDPAPCIARPAISISPVVAPPQRPLPSVKMAMMSKNIHRRPKMLHSWLNRGVSAVLDMLLTILNVRFR
jgi:hypothetical protein